MSMCLCISKSCGEPDGSGLTDFGVKIFEKSGRFEMKKYTGKQ